MFKDNATLFTVAFRREKEQNPTTKTKSKEKKKEKKTAKYESNQPTIYYAYQLLIYLVCHRHS